MRKISVELAARVMRKNPTFVRQALTLGLLPFGMAMPSRRGTQRMQYYINTADFIEYTKVTEEELDALQAEITAKQHADAAKYAPRRRARAAAARANK